MHRPDDTPLMQQWREAKARHPDALIFFRVGDFYELFNEDAVEGARILGLTLTSRNNGGASEVPLAGVPARARDEYLERLVRAGRRVAVCEQVEDPALAKGIVKREVIETITPGAILAESLLAERRNNWLIALKDHEDDYVIAVADISTGEVLASRVTSNDLASELATYEAAEMLLPESWRERRFEGIDEPVRTHRPDWLFDASVAAEETRRRYAVHTLESFGVTADDAPLVSVLGALLAYLAEVQPTALTSLRPPKFVHVADTMVLDDMTRRNLELVEPLRSGPRDGRGGTLVDVIDETCTAMGARLLRRWLLRPLIDARAIWSRQEAVAELHERQSERRALRTALGEVRDLERLAARVGSARIAPREMKALEFSIARIPVVGDALARCQCSGIRDMLDAMDALDDVRDLIQRALHDDAPSALGDGNAIRGGYDADLDELRGIRDNAQDTIARLQATERERTGIASLKIGYNKVFGYYFEVTRANRERVPDDYERRQTLANAERFVTPELKEWEARILGAEEGIGVAEARIFGALRDAVSREVSRIQASADRIAQLDVLAAFAHCAERRGYVRPDVHTGYTLDIRAGRHPVVETMMPREKFIPNDVILDEDGYVMILTGPNMAGKSTLLRQVGLIQLLGQVGAFVPATRARLPVCDRIFTRVGASDNLVRGQSTFMVEMQETAAILHGATPRSLVLLDEIGRGTATWDGVSIAWAVTEHLHEQAKAKTIFATHYHELTQLADLLPGLQNCNVAVREVGQDIIFLHRLQAGGADRSYGIEVGRLAGLPAVVVARAREILRELEGAHSGGGEGLGRSGRHRPRSTPPPDQLSLFQPPPHPVLVRLRDVEPESLTPLQALNLLAELAALVKESGGEPKA